MFQASPATLFSARSTTESGRAALSARSAAARAISRRARSASRASRRCDARDRCEAAKHAACARAQRSLRIPGLLGPSGKKVPLPFPTAMARGCFACETALAGRVGCRWRFMACRGGGSSTEATQKFRMRNSGPLPRRGGQLPSSVSHAKLWSPCPVAGGHLLSSVSHVKLLLLDGFEFPGAIGVYAPNVVNATQAPAGRMPAVEGYVDADVDRLCEESPLRI